MGHLVAPSASLACAALALASGLVVMGLWRSFPGLVVGVIVFTLGQVLFQPIMNAEVSSFADSEAVASYFGVNGLALAVGGITGSVGGGAMYGLLDSANPLLQALPWVVLGCWGLLIAGLLARRARTQARNPVPVDA